jgi:hypothetical protein
MNKPHIPSSSVTLRQRLVEDMTLPGFGEKTQRDYIRIVSRFAAFLGRSPDRATPEDIFVGSKSSSARRPTSAGSLMVRRSGLLATSAISSPHFLMPLLISSIALRYPRVPRYEWLWCKRSHSTRRETLWREAVHAARLHSKFERRFVANVLPS